MTRDQRAVEIELTPRQQRRLEKIREECNDAHTPPPTDRQLLSSLMDTWDAVNDGHYSGVNND